MTSVLKSILLPKKHYIPLCKFRSGNHRLPIEIGRWENIPINERICNLCNKDIGDEFHYLFNCEVFNEEIKVYLKPFFYKRPNILKFRELLTTRNHTCLMELSKFVDIIMKKNV